MGSANFPDNLDIKPFFLQDVHGVQDTAAFSVESQQKSIQKYGIAGRVWEAAELLKTYVEGLPELEFDHPFVKDAPMTVIELGSGTGIVGYRIAKKLSARNSDLVIVTDLPDVCPLLEQNLGELVDDRSSRNAVIVRPLPWGNLSCALSIVSELQLPEDSKMPRNNGYLTDIICSDLVYFPELLAPLLRSLIQLSSPPFIAPKDPLNTLTVTISYKVRSLTKELPFWSCFGLWFSYEPVLVRQQSSSEWARLGSDSEDTLFVFVARRKPESYTWVVPANDQDLLRGVGARGTDDRKADDFFEALMLMSLEYSE